MKSAQQRGLFRTLGEVPDAAAYRRRKRSSLRPYDLRLAALEFDFVTKKGAASTCGLS